MKARKWGTCRAVPVGILLIGMAFLGTNAHAQVTAKAFISIESAKQGAMPLSDPSTDFTMFPSFHNANVMNIPGGFTLGDSTLTGFVSCRDLFTGAVIPNCDVQLHLDVVPNSGGHLHNNNRPTGTFTPSQGNTGPSGFLQAVYTAPDASGVTEILITGSVNSVPIIPGFFTIGVQIDGLVAIPTSGDGFSVIPQSNLHDNNNVYGTPQFNSQIEDLPQAFRAEIAIACTEGGACPQGNPPNLLIGAMNLPQGGLFDFHGTWAPPHHNHRVGWEADLEIQSSITNVQFVPQPFRPLLDNALGDAGFIAPYAGENIDDTSASHWHIIGGH
jgi:hypothetical protein